MTVVSNGKRFSPIAFKTEKDFEEDVSQASKNLFGANTVFINAKRKIESKSLGGAVPDGFFFDFSDAGDPQFYIVEIELTQHSFYNHIFPQITKFFAFFNNQRLQKNLIDKLYSVIDTDVPLNTEFKKYLGKQEIYKFLSDLIDNSQNILLIADGQIAELQEIMETYTDTWGRLVRFLEIRKYVSNQDLIYTISPDFETIQYFEPLKAPDDIEEVDKPAVYSEDFHLAAASQTVKDTYAKIKEIAISLNPELQFNPQKYYVSIKAPKNIAFLKIRKQKIRFIAMMPEKEIRALITKLGISTLSEAVQNFYNGACAAVDIPDLANENEIKKLLTTLVEKNRDA
jgi:predicted transport protein